MPEARRSETPRVLLVHNRYQWRGGEDVVFEREAELLRERGHAVETFVRSNDSIAEMGRLRTSLGTIWSTESSRQLGSCIRAFGPDVVHFHNTFPLISPAAYSAARKEKVPVVQTLHNFRVMCLNAQLFRDGRVCEDCVGRLPVSGVLHGCYRGRLGSLVVAGMLVTHRALKTWSRNVDAYICLTDFARRKYIAGGLPPSKLFTKPNFVDDPGVTPRSGPAYALFVGRLSREKGVETLVEAWRSRNLPFPLKIVGDGPCGDSVRAAAAACRQVEVLGQASAAEVRALMAGASVLLMPSLWYENLPATLTEAFSAGLPVIGSRVGALAELIADGRTGLLFAPGQAADLASKVEAFFAGPLAAEQMSAAARQEYLDRYAPGPNYARLMEIYAAAVSGRVAASGSALPAR